MRREFAYTETLSLTGGKNIALPGIGEISESKMLIAIMVMMLGLMAHTTLLGHLIMFLVGVAVLAVPETSVGVSRTAVGALNYYLGKKNTAEEEVENQGEEETDDEEIIIDDEDEGKAKKNKNKKNKKHDINDEEIIIDDDDESDEEEVIDVDDEDEGKVKKKKKSSRPINRLTSSVVLRHWQSIIGALMLVGSVELFLLDPEGLMVEAVILMVIGLVMLVVDYISTVIEK